MGGEEGWLELRGVAPERARKMRVVPAAAQACEDVLGVLVRCRGQPLLVLQLALQLQDPYQAVIEVMVMPIPRERRRSRRR